ncbi:YggS family pyridoxal phosphate-dependent enzyme [Niallia circulans]|uniref:YggS family pyridoxal phosphate-dependent enzyme n=1 Tax=Niallia TaxID=2837506 RepID=UPI000BA643BD|nr:YggS family pyridoxal phosphate-dependent enzyme [Niallia circulans]PAD89563.1 YggS family pyridoxal phosphate-dependent enzyme [Niallia circulans]PAE14243.1 YggS family pyridoxal phosphate-dependent enzyme [Niallia circulans]
MLVKDNLNEIKQEIAAACKKVNRQPEEVTIIAVTKYVTIERAKEALDAGIVHLGENREEGLLAKYDVLQDKPIWHFIGSLQTRKVKGIIDYVDYIHSLDRLSLAKEIHKRAKRTIKCFVQVNVSNEESKHGMKPEEVIDFVKQLSEYPHIQVVGLMTMAPFTDDKEFLRECFRKLKSIQEDVKGLQLPYAPCTELSMGMSNDYSIAIEEGATMIRIGTALVGSEK